MKLVSLLMKNVRSHRSSEIRFNKGVTVITGRTGSGKTSILMGVDYALFGSANLNNAEIMRRGAKHMLVELRFTHQGREYTVVRGLERKNGRISLDNDNLKVLENGKQLNVMSRARDVDKIISEVLGIPGGVKPSEMFQVTSYTKQDEIRKLLEMRREERQEYIDRMLQLSKYKTTFENLKPVTDEFENELKQIEQVSEFLEKEKQELEKIRKELKEKWGEIADNEKKLETLNKALEKKEGEKEEINEDIKGLKEVVDEKRSEQSELKTLKKQKESVGEKLNSLEEEWESISNELKGLKEVRSEKVITRELNELKSDLRIKEERIKEKKKEREEVSKTKGKCPLCKQVVTEEHKTELVQKFEEEINELNESVEETRERLEEKKKVLGEAERKEELLKDLEKLNSNIRQYGESISELNTKIESFELEDFSEIEEEYEELKEKKERILEKDKRLYSKKESATNLIEHLQEEVNELEDEISGKEEVIHEYEDRVSKKSEYDYVLEFLNNLRNYVKDIRSVIRRKFLNDFKHEFQKKFEEIRNQEDEYSVEVNLDYEPIAYTVSGEEVSIDYLSGGEKTSVALAYRLALSNLAAQMSKVMPAELLILDEPTTGFDPEDVKALPEALRNITSIPQIIIVTHENLLKEIADTTISIKKQGNESIVEY